MEKKLAVGDCVTLSNTAPSYVGKIAAIQGDRVRIDWSGSEFVASRIGEWFNINDLRLWGPSRR